MSAARPPRTLKGPLHGPGAHSLSEGPGCRPEGAPVSEGVPSPCISVCRMNPQTGLCEGCLRTLDEIAAWSRMGDEDKRRVWALLPQRRAQAAATTTEKPA
jgi:uncharacterized protein